MTKKIVSFFLCISLILALTISVNASELEMFHPETIEMKGTLEEIEVDSAKSLVYIPNIETDKWHIAILLHGGGDTPIVYFRGYTEPDRVTLFDGLMDEKKIPPTIIIAPYFLQWPASGDYNPEKFAELMVKTLNKVKTDYNITVEDKDDILIGGLSLGAMNLSSLPKYLYDDIGNWAFMSLCSPEKYAPRIRDAFKDHKPTYCFLGGGEYEKYICDYSANLIKEVYDDIDFQLVPKHGHDWGTWDANMVRFLTESWKEDMKEEEEIIPQKILVQFPPYVPILHGRFMELTVN